MTYPNDPNLGNRAPLRETRTGMSWGLPLGLAALAIVLGLFFLMPRDRTTTATNTSPTTTQSTPAPKMDPVTPAPTPARPATGG